MARGAELDVAGLSIPDKAWLSLAMGVVLLIAIGSLAVGVVSLSWASLLTSDYDADTLLVLLVSRIPRTLALMLSGISLGIAGVIMQLISHNRFAEPTTTGTVESASLGMLVLAILAPTAPLLLKMTCASLFALLGTLLFLHIISRAPLISSMMVPLIGLILSGIIGSVSTFLAYRFDLLQSLSIWGTGDFSSVLQGRYEMLWIALALTGLAYLFADRFTVAGLGRDLSTNLGIGYRLVMTGGLIIVAMITAAVVVTAGMIPFIGLIVPNLVSRCIGDNARRTMPWGAVSSAGLVLLCDIFARLVRHPYELPVGTIAGVLGCLVFLLLLLRGRSSHA
ncbi:ABC transporter permease [Pseudomonas sp. LRF_L74]|uniref:ABC transporter permease n=1 Tax=Pseudomonas sp. LRF_L74 TaxID=3369422 RepID=UPI003F6426CA